MVTSTENAQNENLSLISKLGVLFPGCFFVPLFLVSYGNSIAWLPFFFIWIICAVWFCLMAIPNLISIIGKKPPLHQNRKVLRLFVIVIVIPVALCASVKSSHTANAYAVDVAQTIQNEIDCGGVCPKTIDGWEQRDSSFKSTTYYGKYGAKYRVIYLTDPNQEDFRVRVAHNFEMNFYVEGGVGKELKSFFSGVPLPLDYYK